MKKSGLPRKPRHGDIREIPGGRVAAFEEEAGQAGHYRVVDTIGLMLRNGTIDMAMHDAARAFAQDFAAARLMGHKAVNPNPSGGFGCSMTERAAMALRRVHRAMDAVGGFDSLTGSLLWDVVGQGLSLREWCDNGWRGRKLDIREARGVMLSLLPLLAKSYRFVF